MMVTLSKTSVWQDAFQEFLCNLELEDKATHLYLGRRARQGLSQQALTSAG